MMSMDLTPSKSCPEWEELKAWVDQELDPTRQASLRAHVETCASCQEEARLMRQIGTSLRQLEGSVEPSAELRGRILARIGERSRSPWWSLPGNPFAMLRWVTVATAVLVVGLVGRQAIVTQPSRQTASGAAPTAAPASPPPNAKAAMKGEGPGPMADAVRTDPTSASRAVDSVAPAAEMSRASPDFAAQSYAQGAPGGAPMAGGAAMGGAPPMAASPPPAATTVAPSAPDERESSQQPQRARRAATRPETYSSAPGRVSPADVNQYTRGKAIEDVKRKVVRRADLTVRTRSPLESVQKEIQARLQKDDGYVESSNLTVPAGTERTARMTLRVPVGKLDEYVTWLAGLGEVQAKSVRGEDVTGTWVDQRAEVRELRKEEERLLETYNTHRSRERREEARRLLLTLRPRIAISEERFAVTGKLAALSTLTLTLIEPEQVRVQGSLWQDLDRTARAAVASFIVALRVPAAILIWLVVFSPLWVPCLLLYRWAARKAQEWPQR